MTLKRVRRALFELCLWLMALMILVPLALIVINSVKSKPEANVMSLALPKVWLFQNYAQVVREGHMAMSVFNSLVITLGSVLLTTLSAAMGAFVLARRRSRLTRGAYLFFVLGLLAPINYIPTIRIMQFFGIMNTYQGIILLYTALMIPFTMFLFYGFVNTVPRDMDEAAIIDGSSAWTLFLVIQLPLMSPVINHRGADQLYERVERFHSAAVFLQPLLQLSVDACGLQLLRHLHFQLEPGLRGDPADRAAHSGGVHGGSEIHHLRHDRRRDQGLTSIRFQKYIKGMTPGAVKG